MVRSFGLLLVVGIAIAFALAFVAGFAALELCASAGGGSDGCPGDARRPVFRSASSASSASAQGEKPSARRGTRRSRLRPTRGDTRHSRPCCNAFLSWLRPIRSGFSGSVLLLAVIGWGLGTQIETQTDIRALAPQNVEAVRELNELQDATGVSGELDVERRVPPI